MRVWPLSNSVSPGFFPMSQQVGLTSLSLAIRRVPPSHLAVCSVIELLLFTKVWRVKQAIYLPTPSCKASWMWSLQPLGPVQSLLSLRQKIALLVLNSDNCESLSPRVPESTVHCFSVLPGEGKSKENQRIQSRISNSAGSYFSHIHQTCLSCGQTGGS